MSTSVIVPTYQGANKISYCIDALLNQSIDNFEIIIAIDGSTDNTEAIAREQLKDFSNFKIIKQENKGRASIRNFGVKNAIGDLIIFYDDDMRPFHNSVEKHIDFHEKNINCILQGTLLSDESKLNTDIQKYKFYLENIWNKYLNDEGIDKSSPYISAAHFSTPTKIFNALKGFDESLSDAEDFDLSIRILESGYNIHYDPSNKAYHNDFITIKSYIKRRREYAVAQEQWDTLFPERMQKHSKRSFTRRKGWKGIVYKIVSSKKLVKMIDNENQLIISIPKKIRYKLYEIVIQGLSNYYPNKKL